MTKKLDKDVIFKVSAGILAYAYIFYRILSSDISNIPDFNRSESILLSVFILLLVPVNWFTEAVKWKKLVRKIKNISIQLSYKAVLTGLTYSVFTPNRIGELFGRPMIFDKKDRKKAFFATLIGSFSQLGITITMGFAGGILVFFFYSEKIKFIDIKSSILVLTISGIALIFLIVILFNLKKIIKTVLQIKIFSKLENAIVAISEYSKQELIYIMMLSAVRYLIFSFQYYLLLILFGAEITILQAFIGISLSYLASSGIPSITLTEIGVRGSVSIFFLGFFVDSDTIILAASSSLWIINVAFPASTGAFLLFAKTRYKKDVFLQSDTKEL